MRLNKYVDEILNKVVIPKSTRAINEDMIIQTINFFFSNMATTLRARYLQANNSSVPKIVTYFGMTIAPSNSGKSHTYNMLKNDVFAWFTDKQEERYRKSAKEYNEKVVEEIREKLDYGLDEYGFAYKEKDAKAEMSRRLLNTDYAMSGLCVDDMTIEGIAASRARVANMKLFGHIVTMDEMSSMFTSKNVNDITKALLSVWEDGNLDVKATKYDQVASAKNIPMCFLGYTAEGKLFTDKKDHSGLLKMLSLGLARRTHIVYANWEDFKSDKLQDIDEAKKDEIADIGSRIRNNINSMYGVQMEFDDEAKKRMREYSNSCIERSRKLHMTTEIYVDAFAGMGAKAEKLAALYSFIDGRQYINIDDVEDAIAWTEHLIPNIEIVSKIRTPSERIFYDLYRSSDWVNSYQIEMRDFFNSNGNFQKQLEDSLPNISQIASSKNCELVVSEIDGGKRLKVNKIEMVDINNIGLSYKVADWDDYSNFASGFKYNTVDFDRLDEFMCSGNRMCVVPSKLRDGIRKDTNTYGSVHMLILDFDDGLTWEEAEDKFRDYTYFMYETKSHKKDKNGVVADRFRVMLPLDRTITLSTEKYKRMMKNIIAVFAPEADKTCINPSQLFANNPDANYVYNYGKHFPAHYFVESEKTETIYRAGVKLETSGLKNYFLTEIDTVNQNKTGGVNLLVKASLATRDALGFRTKEDSEAWIRELSKLIFSEYWQRHNFETEVLPALDKAWDK